MSIHNWNCSALPNPPLHFEQHGIKLNVEVGMNRYVAKLLETQGKPIPAPVKCFGLIDTGCSRTSISIDIARSLGLPELGQMPMGTANGVRMAPTFAFSVALETSLVLDCIQGTGSDLHGQDIGVLIGMDLLSKCIVILNGPGGTFSIAR